MCEIKFRAWDKTKLRFVDQLDKLAVTLDGKHIYYLDNDFATRNDLVLQRYTGIKDKNEKEIYEGDILLWRHPMPDIGVVKYVADSPFDNYPFQAYYALDTVRLGNCLFQADDSCLILGNICENPELNES